jgi:dTDP-4-dehydrorhamnose reductase
MRITLFGAGGPVGHELLKPLAALGELVVHDRTSADLQRPHELTAAVRQERPDLIVNAAAYTAVDKAESEPEKARHVNGTAVTTLGHATADLGATLVHFSTDYVFDGTKAGRYVETDEPRPLSFYGRTKLEGEEAVAATGCRHWIFRTSLVYAAHGHNFVRTILRLAREREEFRVVDDQFGSPKSAELIAAVTAIAVGRLAARLGPLPTRASRRDHLVPVCEGRPGGGTRPRRRPPLPAGKRRGHRHPRLPSPGRAAGQLTARHHEAGNRPQHSPARMAG